MPAKDPFRSHALKTLIEHVDLNPGVYQTNEQQEELLEQLIQSNQLKDCPMAERVKGVIVTLTVARYRDFIHQTLKDFGRKDALSKFFNEGSETLQTRYLNRIGFVKQSIHQDNADEEQRSILSTCEGQNTSRTSSQQPQGKPIEVQALVAPDLTQRKRKRSPSVRILSSASQSGQGKVQSTNEMADEPVNAMHPTVPNAVISTTPRVGEGSKAANKIVQPLDVVDEVPPPAATSTLSSKLVKLSSDEIHKTLDAIWQGVQSTSRKIANGTKINPAKRVTLVVHPVEELESLYTRLFGVEWKERAKTLAMAGCVKAIDIIEGLLAADLFVPMTKRIHPWDGPRQTLAKLSSEHPYLDEILQASAVDVKLDALVWQAARNKFLDPGFRHDVITPKANTLATDWILATLRQLEILGTAAVDNSDHFWQQRSKEISAMFSKILILRGQLQAAPDYYRAIWMQSGRKVCRELMEELHPSEGDQEVTWCVSPLIQVRATANQSWAVACQAKVFSRPFQG